MSTYKLTYYDLQGLGEPARYLFKLAGIPFEDDRIPKNDDTYPKLPADIKNNLPWGTLPMLEVNGVKIGQSSAICRLLAHRFNLAGKDDVEKAKCDEYVDAIRDFGNEFRALMSCEDEVKKGEMMKKLKEVTVPLYLGKFEMILQTQDKKCGSKWLVGKSVTWADVVVAHFLTLIETRSKIPMTASFPSIKKMMDDFYAIKEIKEWIAVRPATD